MKKLIIVSFLRLIMFIVIPSVFMVIKYDMHSWGRRIWTYRKSQDYLLLTHPHFINSYYREFFGNYRSLGRIDDLFELWSMPLQKSIGFDDKIEFSKFSMEFKVMVLRIEKNQFSNYDYVYTNDLNKGDLVVPLHSGNLIGSL